MFDGVGSLVDQCLLLREDGAGDEPRFRMLETVHEFALEQLEASDEAETVRRRHAAWCLGLAEEGWQAFWRGALDARLFIVLVGEQANVRAALAWALEADPEFALRLAAALGPPLWFYHGQFEEGRAWLARALVAAGPDASSRLRARATLAAGQLACEQWDHAPAEDILRQALIACREVDDPWGVALAQGLLGIVARHEGRYDEAETLLEASLRWFASWNDKVLQAVVLHNLAALAFGRSDLGRAAERTEEALAAGRSVGEAFPAIAWMLTLRGAIRTERRQFADAARDFGDAVARTRSAADESSIHDVLALLSVLAAARGDPDAAARLLGAADARSRAVGAPLAESAKPVINRTRKTLLAVLGEAVFVSISAAGAALSPEQALAEAEGLAHRLAQPGVTDRASRADNVGLTPREREVLCRLAAGRTYQEVADDLFVSLATVRTHVQHVYAKLGCTSRHEATAVARERGLC